MERYENEREFHTKQKNIILSDGREFTRKSIFNAFLKEGPKPAYMWEALRKLVIETRIVTECEFDNVSTNKPGIEFETLYSQRKPKRYKTEEVDVVYDNDGLDLKVVSSDTLFRMKGAQTVLFKH